MSASKINNPTDGDMSGLHRSAIGSADRHRDTFHQQVHQALWAHAAITRGGPNDEYTETEVTRIVDMGPEDEPQARRSLPLHWDVSGGSCDCRVS